MTLSDVADIAIAACSIALIAYQHYALRRADSLLDSAQAALEAADKAIDTYKNVMLDVATGHIKLEVTENGNVIATHRSAGKIQRH